MPHSLKAPRELGSKDGEGGGDIDPVKPQIPSWFKRSVSLGMSEEGTSCEI